MKKLDKGLGIWQILDEAYITEIIASAGFDLTILDLEHGQHNFKTIQNCVYAAKSSSIKTIVRVPRIDKKNKEHVDMLQKMRAETRELERLRGVWSERGLPGMSRDWNVQVAKTKTEAPRERLEYKEYVDYKEAEKKRKSNGTDRHLVIKTKEEEEVDGVLVRALPSTVPRPNSRESSSLKSKAKK